MNPTAVVALSGAGDLPVWVQWVSALGPAATLLAAVAAGGIAVASLIQRKRADAKAEWWRRTQWALDQMLSTDLDRQGVGAVVLVRLSQSELASVEDLALFEAAWDALLDDLPDVQEYVLDDGEGGDGAGRQDP